MFVSTVVNHLLEGLRDGGIVFYKSLWSILLGVSVTAAIDVFVDKDRMGRFLGGRDVKTTGFATVLGAASSACTFGAVTIAQTLFKKGASTEAALAFSLASTNIVFELAILIYVLLGPAFVAAELLSGFLLVVLMYLLVRATLPVRLFDEARQSLQERETDFHFVHAAGGGAWWRQLAGLSGWYYISLRYFRTLRVIYKSVVFGFLIAGFIIALVPHSLYSRVFLSSDTFLGVLENGGLGVLVGIFSFIGSIGIVPFAAALAIGGAGFAGVLGCIISDNITIPVLNVWKAFYGTRATAYILVVFFVAMVASSVLVEYLFRALHWLPRPGSARLPTISLSIDYTLVLTVLFLALTAALFVATRVGKHRFDTPGAARRAA